MTGSVTRRAVRADLFAVYKLLNPALNRVPFFGRQRGFWPVWGCEEPYGYLVEDAGEVVGFLGTLNTRREVRGKLESFCEIHSWYVKDEYRNQSMNLLLPVIAQKRTKTIINFTPTPPVYEMGAKLGFKDLETAFVAFYPWPMQAGKAKIVTEPWLIPGFLQGEDLRIFNDHKDITCHHIVLLPEDDAGGVPLYAVIKTLHRRWFEPFGRLIYVNDRPRFSDLLGRVCWRLCAKFKWLAIVANADHFKDLKPRVISQVDRRDVSSQFISSRLEPSDINQLYSQPLLMGYPLH
jgi:hypothetical protein